MRAETECVPNNQYTDFAYIYDRLTDDVEYGARADYIEKLIAKYLPRKAELICDLGCGTGTMCTILANRGYDCIGVDNSESMLNVAMAKNTENKILYLNQDMTDFELYGTVDVIICILDSINYITEPEKLERMFGWINNYLNPGGIFIFDVNTEYKFKNILGDNTLVYETNNIFYTWENHYEDEFVDFELNFFVEQDGKYQRITEQHTQRYYSERYLCDALEKAGLKCLAKYDDLTFEPVKDNSEREFFVFIK